MDRSDTGYERWVETQSIPVVRGYSCDLNSIELGQWSRNGGRGAFVILEGGQGTLDAYLCEIPVGQSLLPGKHLFEEQILILSGRGETTIWQEGGTGRTVYWQAGSLFSPPLNAFHQHVNLGDQPARFVAVTSAPVSLNLFRNPHFVFNAPYVFADRFNGEADYFQESTAELVPAYHSLPILATNVVPDVRTMALPRRRDFGYRVQLIRLSNNVLEAHVAEFPPGTYKEAHRHWPGAHLIVLEGSGCTMMWPPDGPRVRVDWAPAHIFAPPGDWFHQHFNLGPGPARLVALRRGNEGIGKLYGLGRATREGGDVISFLDEGAEVRTFFESELESRGLRSNMPAVAGQS